MPPKMNWRKVTILNPEHLLEQSERLIQRGMAGAPRQVDLRRAVSSAYYSVFHATMTAAADNLMGRTRRSSAQYALAYRSIDHKSLRDICEEIRRPTLRDRYKPYEPAGGFGIDIRARPISSRSPAEAARGRLRSCDTVCLFRGSRIGKRGSRRVDTPSERIGHASNRVPQPPCLPTQIASGEQ
jgi:hypothetical protein